jgi:hypothetical protein
VSWHWAQASHFNWVTEEDFMKTKVLTLLVLSLMAVSCANKESSNANNTSNTPVVVIPNGPYVPPYQAPGYGSNFGATTDLTIASTSVMSDYTQRPMYAPTNVKINLNLVKYGSTYGGNTTISYTDYGTPYTGSFTSGNSAPATQFNVWFTSGGKKVWHGFFEDYYGGLIVVIDDGIVDLGDGNPPTLDKVSGSVWFKNFGYTYAPHPPTYCWFVSLGPYDCRSWKSGKTVNSTAAVNPTDGYVKLGTFTNLDVKAAFNNQLSF